MTTLRLTLVLVFVAPMVVDLSAKNNRPEDDETGVFDNCARRRVELKFGGARNAVTVVRIAVIQTRKVGFGFDVRLISLSTM